MSEPVPPLVTFVIPVGRPRSLANQARQDAVLTLTLRSIFAQSDPDFRVLVAIPYQPKLSAEFDGRLEIVIMAGWTSNGWLDGNHEGGARKGLLTHMFAQRGGGYLMHCDTDDFVHRDLVAHVRATRDPNGYAFWDGYIYNATENCLTPYPWGDNVDHRFHHLCGSSLIVRYDPADILESGPDGSLFDRLQGGGHHLAVAAMEAAGRPLARLPFRGTVYVRNTGDNLSRMLPDWDDPSGREGMLGFESAIVQYRLADEGDLRAVYSLPDRYPISPRLSTPRTTAPYDRGPSLSVLVCTHRRPEGLAKLLAALAPQIGEAGDRELVVVNDGTHDDAYADAIAPYQDVIRYRALKTNIGIAQARNTAAAMARFDYLVFTDDDCEPPPHWLDWLSMRLSANPELDVVAGTTRPLWPKKPSFFAKVRAAHNLIPTTANVAGTMIFPTAIVAIRRSMFERLGGFGFGEFHGAGEDTEMATRLSLQGAASIFDPAWFTRHEISEGLRATCGRYRRYGFANGRLATLTTSPVAHDYIIDNAGAAWKTIWGWEYPERLRAARAVHGRTLTATASAMLAMLVKLSYWRGIKAGAATG
jgi:glycosyltransferase involved in cell wall biosynthesis